MSVHICFTVQERAATDPFANIDSGPLAKGQDKLDGRLMAAYYGWMLAHRCTYFCCGTLSIFAVAEVVFYGMKFDVGQVSCWGVASGVCAGFDQLVFQPVLALVLEACCGGGTRKKRRDNLDLADLKASMI